MQGSTQPSGPPTRKEERSAHSHKDCMQLRFSFRMATTTFGIATPVLLQNIHELNLRVFRKLGSEAATDQIAVRLACCFLGSAD